MKQSFSVVLCVALIAAAARAEVLPVRGIADSRVRVANYNGDEVYTLHGFVGYQIDLEFEAGEIFLGLGAGDLEGLSFVGQDNHLFLKPKAARVATNLTVLTSRRHYHFDYTVLAQRPEADHSNVIYALRFIYAPNGQAAADALAKALDARLQSASSRRVQNTDYWYCGEHTLKPIAAADDGVHTRLRFSPNAELPAVFVRNDDGSESLLNFNMQAGDLVVHRVARRFILRRGRLTGCILNRGFAGSGARLDSGTVDPGVIRRVDGEAP